MRDDGHAPPDLTALSGGWQVEPSQLRAFAEKVSEVRAGLEHVRLAASELGVDPAQLGTSPVGDGLTAKFSDRAGADGLIGELNKVINQVDAFVTSAQQTVVEYEERDAAAADSLRAE
jgi:hypothetical protein